MCEPEVELAEPEPEPELEHVREEKLSPEPILVNLHFLKVCFFSLTSFHVDAHDSI